MENPVSCNLSTVRSEFEAWRSQRKKRERIPEKLWQSAISMLDYYPFQKVRKELNLNSRQLQNRAMTSGKLSKQRSNGKIAKRNHRANRAFLEVSAADLTNSIPLSNNETAATVQSTCRIVFERNDGSRLSMNLPVEWNHIQSICSNFLRS
jgi:hypothetical protein